MIRLSEILSRNKLYLFLAVFVLSINILSFTTKKIEDLSKDEVVAGQAIDKESKIEETPNIFDEDRMAEQEERIKDLAQKNPPLYVFIGAFNLLIVFSIFLGLILDGYFIRRFFKKEVIDIRTMTPEQPLWTIADVGRVVLVFLSAGYLFAFIEAFLAKLFPILANENFTLLIDTAAMNLIGIGVIFFFIVKKYGQKISAIGLSSKNWPKNVLYGLAGYFTIIPIVVVVMIITFFVIKFLKYQPPLQPIVEIFMKEKESVVLLFSTIFAAIFGPIAEEIFFRGFMYSALRKRLGAIAGILITASIFAFLHAHLVGFMPIFILGVLLAYLYEKTGSLVSSLAVHITHNVGMVILVFIVKNIGT